MKKHIQWLKLEILRWTEQGIITADQAQLISAQYKEIGEPNSWGKIIFSAIGAILIGLGVILLFAYNWEGMHRLVKLGLVLSSVIVAHSVGWFLYFKGRSFQRQHSQRLGESLHLLGTMLFGAGIWLIAQIYHIDEHYPNGIFVWSLGAIAMAWVLSSSVHALLAMALIGFWCGAEVFDFNRDLDWAPWVISCLVMPLAWRKNSPLLMFFSSILFVVLLFFVSVNHDIELIIHMMFIIAIGFMALAKLMPVFHRERLSNVLFAVGTLMYFSLLFAFSFVEVTNDIWLNSVKPLALIIYLLIPSATLFALSYWVWRRRAIALPSRIDQIDGVMKLLTLLVLLCFTIFFESGIAVVWFNMALFAHSILYLLSGMENIRWQRVAFGSFVLALLIFVRFLDLFDSLLMRSLAFIVLGVGLFAVGIVFSRQKAKELEGTSNA